MFHNGNWFEMEVSFGTDFLINFVWQKMPVCQYIYSYFISLLAFNGKEVHSRSIANSVPIHSEQHSDWSRINNHKLLNATLRKRTIWWAVGNSRMTSKLVAIFTQDKSRWTCLLSGWRPALRWHELDSGFCIERGNFSYEWYSEFDIGLNLVL